MESKKAILTPDATYHIYNRANGNEKIFANEGNYFFFLEKYKQYIFPIADTFCYCLMPNHFHFLIRIKSEKELMKTFKSNLTGFENLSGLISKEFSNLFNSYSKAFNKQQSRKGSLFMRPFKRKRVTDENYLRKLVHYIHYNPMESGISSKPEQWKHSSYNEIIETQTLGGVKILSKLELRKNEVIDWFGDKENFIYCHRSLPKETGIEKF
jgi:putative transposase